MSVSVWRNRLPEFFCSFLLAPAAVPDQERKRLTLRNSCLGSLRRNGPSAMASVMAFFVWKKEQRRTKADQRAKVSVPQTIQGRARRYEAYGCWRYDRAEHKEARGFKKRTEKKGALRCCFVSFSYAFVFRQVENFWELLSVQDRQRNRIFTVHAGIRCFLKEKTEKRGASLRTLPRSRTKS